MHSEHTVWILIKINLSAVETEFSFVSQFYDVDGLNYFFVFLPLKS